MIRNPLAALLAAFLGSVLGVLIALVVAVVVFPTGPAEQAGAGDHVRDSDATSASSDPSAPAGEQSAGTPVAAQDPGATAGQATADATHNQTPAASSADSSSVGDGSPALPGSDDPALSGQGRRGARGTGSAFRPPEIPLAPTPDPLSGRLWSDPPGRDLVELAARMGRTRGMASRTVEEPRPAMSVGETTTFWVHDIVAERYFTVDARLETATDVANLWVQSGLDFDREALESGARDFSEQVYPAVRSAFGSEWQPGVDGDPKINILHHQPITGIAGYFSSSDEFITAVEPHSNEREMFYINLSVYTPGSYDWLALLSHEFQHMIHWNHDPNEPVWSNEGLSELATIVAGYPATSGEAFFSRPGTALLEWDVNPGKNAPDYAASFAFMNYIHSRFGPEVIRSIVAAEANGPLGIESALDVSGWDVSFDDVFLDWSVTNLADDPAAYDGQFSYRESPLGPVRPSSFPAAGADSQVNPYASAFYNVTGEVENGALTLALDGQPAVGLLQPQPEREGLVWWSNRGDGGDSHLTRTFDLTSVTEAELAFDVFYELEPNWDYGYYLVSRDGGATWERLETGRTTDTNPNGNNYGDGVTGLSQTWVTETLNLNPYAGGQVTVRFEVITDDAVNLMGMAVDNLRLDPLGFSDDASSNRGWEAAGWQQVPLAVPGRWVLQAVVTDADGDILGVARTAADPAGNAVLTLNDLPRDASVTAVVSNLTRASRHPGRFTLNAGDG